MNRLVFIFLAAVAVLVVGTLNYVRERGEGPQPGETVRPALTGFTSWTAGQPVRLGVRLLAQSEATSRPRALGFFDSNIDPAATVTFFAGDQPVGYPVEAALTYRCCGGHYQTPAETFTVPESATHAKVVVHVPLSLPDVEVKDLEQNVRIGKEE